MPQVMMLVTLMPMKLLLKNKVSTATLGETCLLSSALICRSHTYFNIRKRNLRNKEGDGKSDVAERYVHRF